jgi:DNA-binding beta-propeller fold protein YncE
MTKGGVCNLPNFEPLLLMMDHTGNFATQVAHLNTPELEVSSNDHAVGQVIDAVSHSPCWSSTAIFIIEDDSQNGPDHVDAHRSVGFIASPWVRSNSIVHTNYNTTSMLRTIEDILGVQPLGLQDATAEPMSDAFSTTPNLQPYSAIIPGDLCQSPVDPALVPGCSSPSARKSKAYRPLHAGAWWQHQSDANYLVWNAPDKNDASIYNTLLWNGIKGSTPYPSASAPSSARIDSDDAR